jgi:hypothetical protein
MNWRFYEVKGCENMKNSTALYAGIDHNGFQMIVWKTDLGLITTVEGKLDQTVI